ncbi:MAG: acetolactate synthase [Clostridia bacterium]|nr:acetolactate synthase [Clostridia bacterium]
MSLNQISVFVENMPGRLQLLTDALAKNRINMRALSLAETSEFGIVRIIVDDLEAAVSVLKEESFIYTVTKVLGVAIPDEPGGLNRVLNVLSGRSLNVEYMYAFLGGKDAAHAYMIFHVQAPDEAVSALSEEGITCIDDGNLANL